MEKLKTWIARIRAWLDELEGVARAERIAAIPHADRRADDVAAWKVVRDALLVH